MLIFITCAVGGFYFGLQTANFKEFIDSKRKCRGFKKGQQLRDNVWFRETWNHYNQD